MSDERRWGDRDRDRDRDWRGDRERNDYGERERGRQDERMMYNRSSSERYRDYDQGRQFGGRMDYDSGNPGRSGREAWGGGQPYGGDWPNYSTDYDYRSRTEYGDYDRDYGRGYAGSRLERSSGYGLGTRTDYTREERGGWGGGLDYGGNDYGRSEYGRSSGGARGGEDRHWLDKAGDEVQSWFGDRDAERRRQRDHMRHGEHRGRGPSGYRRSDERIREDVNDRLSDDSWLDASGIEVAVHSGEVTLTGMVHDRRDKRHAEDLVEHVSGVQHVQNNLRLKTTSGSLATTAMGQAHTGAATTSSTAGTAASGMSVPGGASGATVGAGQQAKKETI
jgi:osmotically-inducible protein OsmY